ncbi:hypothetical protein MBLNU459_g0443t1 [Dothideomycetes sp. NU459]
MESPYRFVMSPSKSAPDVTVSSLVDRFNTLQVKDRDEEKSAKQIKRLEAALRRAEMAREEAESEAKSLRVEIRDVQDALDERQQEKGVLRQRLDEYERKYEKAKERFREQRIKNDEGKSKMAKEFMEREKQHWRQTTAAEEQMRWERKLRTDAHDLLAFLEIERHFQMSSVPTMHQPRHQKESIVLRQTSSAPRAEEVAKEREDSPTVLKEDEQDTAIERCEEETSEPMEDVAHEDYAEQTKAEPAEEAVEEAIEPEQEKETQQQHRETKALATEAAAVEESMAETEEEAEMTVPSPAEEPFNHTPASTQDLEEQRLTDQQTQTPQKPQPTLIPINFNDSPSSDKENAQPLSAATAITTPAKPAQRSISMRTPSRQMISTPNVREAPATVTNAEFASVLGKGEVIDRAAALAAIQYRRGRAKSFMNAQMTPKRLGLLEGVRRDISAPPLVTMSVGRKNTKV